MSDQVDDHPVAIDIPPNRFAKLLRIEWLGQTVASLCWIGSVLVSGVSFKGDWLQLFAASSWLLANIAAAVARSSSGDH